ncbi:MAG: class I SAM-dependent methyltransferase [Oscillospiraceae bacterium]|nr:class I SAM-dependent methyltransferase [Oscillospiraceae bacterium]
MSSYVSLAKYYDKLTTDVPYGTFADFYEQIFKRFDLKPVTILDMACGTGTLTRILCERGYDMIASDGSPDMLMSAMEKLSDLESMPLLLCQNMNELDLYGTVDSIICSLDGINYVEKDVLPEVLRRVMLFLEPGGIFIFDINTPEKLLGLDGEMFIDETDDVYCVWRAEYDEELDACVYGMDIFEKKGKLWHRTKEEHYEYIYRLDEMKSLLENAGFEDINIFAELKLEYPGNNEQRVFFTARKPKL